MSDARYVSNPDVVLVGTGIMSASLGALLKKLDPALRIQVFEVTDGMAEEASNGWNNAGTGHAGLCELSYTPFKDENGRVIITKAIEVYEEFERSLLFWAYAVASGMISNPRDFINPVPHLSFVYGEEQVGLLADRQSAMSRHHFFDNMEFTTDKARIESWAPLLTEGRADMPIAATRVMEGTDVNFGEIARRLLTWLGAQDGCAIATGHRVIDLKRSAEKWNVTARDLKTNALHRCAAKFVFVGAGGGSLHLLQKSGIPESRGLGGFPVGGGWLVCTNPDVIARHNAKVYGQAQPEAPTMAVPHLDSRTLDGQRCLLFGPFAAWTTRFLHRRGSCYDLPCSIRPDNLMTLLRIGISNIPLIRYLVREGTQTMGARLRILRRFYPDAKEADWKLIDAGIRVQAIKKTDGLAGIVHYGTEVITSKDGSIAALLGASPGASVSVSIVLDVIRRCFPHLVEGETNAARMREMIPSYGVDIKQPDNADYFRTHHREALNVLGIRNGNA